jgi:cobalt/nickel transport system permease protein
MHIPDGFLSLPVSIGMYVITIIFWIIAFKKAKEKIGEKHVPFLAVIAAAIFAGQMLNFTLLGIGGTSGHLLGAALAAIIFGPYGALIVLSLVLIVQAFLFADGGIIVLGANIFNMGIIAPITAYFVFILLRKMMRKSVAIPSFFAAFFSVVVASLTCAVQLGLSGTVEMSKAIMVMVPIHAVIGIGEGIITLSVLAFIQKTRPDLLVLKKVS